MGKQQTSQDLVRLIQDYYGERNRGTLHLPAYARQKARVGNLKRLNERELFIRTQIVYRGRSSQGDGANGGCSPHFARGHQRKTGADQSSGRNRQSPDRRDFEKRTATDKAGFCTEDPKKQKTINRVFEADLAIAPYQPEWKSEEHISVPTREESQIDSWPDPNLDL